LPRLECHGGAISFQNIKQLSVPATILPQCPENQGF